MKFGQFEINTFVEQKFKLDGGTMFGVIPKSMWSGMISPDENNLIPVQTNIFILKAHGKVFMFDAGLGDTLSKREKKVYGTNGKSSMEAGLKTLGLTRDDIDYVILTHLHTDHAGGAVRFEDDKFVPAFPKAKYVLSKQEWEDAIHPNERTNAVYDPERYFALKDSGQVEMIDADTELFPGIRAVFTGGHTEGHFALKLESEGHKVFYYADIFCMSHHVRVPFVPAADISPLQTMEVKRKVLPEIIHDEVVMAFDHDTVMPLAKVKLDGEHVAVVPV